MTEEMTNGPDDDQGTAETAAPADAVTRSSAIPQAELDMLTDDLIGAIKTVYDPEIPVDIYELGLIYKIDVSDDRDIDIDMTLTAPGCPVAGELPQWVSDAVSSVDGVGDVKVNLVFDPPWSRDMMTEEAQLEAGLFF